MRRINAALTRFGVLITAGVGSMWCALLFVGIAVLATPGVFPPITAVAVWVAQVLLQLVLLSVIMVGQNVQAARTEQIIRDTHDEVTEALTELKAILEAVHVQVKD